MARDGDGPNPDAVLEEAQRRSRGKLRLFLGMAPGVGKTYAMLTEAHQRRKSGKDCLIGWVDTHSRPDTMRLLKGLEILPRKRMRRGTVWTEELDVDEILRRRPSVVVVDEMPHTNPPGSRHARRWQDIEEILDMGIDVWSALNIQHLESLNGVVARVTGVEVSETVPDRVFDEADEVRLIDLPPDDLIARLNAGKIYLPQVIERARANYFRRSNLIALRELALRFMASRMESQIRSERLLSTRQAVEDTSYGALLVMEYPSLEAVREMSRLARALSSPWHVVWMESALSIPSDSPRVTEVLKFAESLGAETDKLAGDYAAEIGQYAREHNLSLVAVLTASTWQTNARARALKKGSPELNLIFLAAQGSVRGSLAQRLLAMVSDFNLSTSGWWQAAASVGVLCLLLYPLRNAMEPTNHAMIYLLAVLFCGVRYGSGPAALAAMLAVVAFDFTVVEPWLSFSVANAQYFITFLVMLLVGLVAGQLVARRQKLAQAANKREHQTRQLYEASRAFSRALSVDEALKVLSGTLNGQASAESEFWLPDWPEDSEDDEPRKKDAEHVEFSRAEAVLKGADPAVIRWCFDHRQAAGRGTHTLASSNYWYVPMEAGGDILAVVVISFRAPQAAEDPVTRNLAEALIALGAQTLQRIDAAQDARQALIAMEGERLRHTLIQSLSHDLRTPVTMLRMSAEGLLARLSKGDLAAARTDAGKLLESTERMERLVINLLEMARLQTGGIKLSESWIPADELFGMAIAEMGERLRDYRVDIRIADDCPLLYGDEVLLLRVMTNLLDNAAKYCPKGSVITMAARRRGDRVAASVSDNGPGLPAGNPQRLFDPFRRGRRENAVSGVGLGLAICRTIARAHDAEIIAGDSPAGGAAFTLMLPLVPVPEMDDEEKVLAQHEDDPEALPKASDGKAEAASPDAEADSLNSPNSQPNKA